MTTRIHAAMMRARILLCFLLGTFLVPGWLHAEPNPTYRTIAEAVDTAVGQGEGALNLGSFTGKFQNFTFVIKNTKTSTFQHTFDYRYGAIYSGSIYFKEAP